MKTFGSLLQDNRDAILRRWLADTLATYPADGAAAFGRQTDQFANPVGHTLRVGTRGVFNALLGGADAEEEMDQHLGEIIKIRAVQQFTASQAVGFVFLLKEAIRAELGEAAVDPRFSRELAQIEERIDRIALLAFDVFVRCREQVCQLRVNEVKRRTSWVVDKMNGRDLDRESVRVDPE